MRERGEDGSNLFSICFAVTNERNRKVRKGFAPCEVPPFRPVNPLEDQKKQKEVREIVNNVDGLRFDDVLSICPGDVNRSACREASACGRTPGSRTAGTRTNKQNVDGMSDVERRYDMGRTHCTLNLQGLLHPRIRRVPAFRFADWRRFCVATGLESLPRVIVTLVHHSTLLFHCSPPID